MHASRRFLVLCLAPLAALAAVVAYVLSVEAVPASQKLVAEALNAATNEDWARVAQLYPAIERQRQLAEHSRFLRAAQLYADGDLEAALQHLSALDPQPPLRVPALFLVGKVLYALARVAEAQDVFASVVNEEHSHVEARFWLVRLAHERGSLDEALAHLAAIAQLRPFDYRPFRRMGEYHFDFSEYRQAAELLGIALERSPPPEARQAMLIERGRALFELHDYQGAIASLEAAQPDAVGLAVLAEAYAAAGRPDDADRAIAQARELNANERLVRLAVARLAQQRSRPAEAAEPLAEYLKQHPNDREFRYLLAQAYEALGRAEEAERERAIKARLDVLFDRHTELNEQAAKRPLDPDIRDELAEICDKLGQPRQADQWRKAAAICRQTLARRATDQKIAP